MDMKLVGATEFKTHCLRLIEEVRTTGLPLTVTRRGVPVVTVLPAREQAERGSLIGTILHQDEDILSTGEVWEAESR